MNTGPDDTLSASGASLKERAAHPARPRVPAGRRDPMIGAELHGYRVVRPLASGGMATVYLAEYTSSLAGATSLRAAVKVLRPQLAGVDELARRFINEAHAATQIKTDGIVKIMAVDRHESGCLYILMELLDGMCLRDRLIRDKRLGLAKALSIIRQCAVILQAVHDADIVHRDLKPENIFLARDTTAPDEERVKLLDFGIAKLPADAPGHVETGIDARMGTAQYMAPEQWASSERVDHRTDLYTLGCILYEMITGRAPLPASGSQDDAQHASMLRHMLEPPQCRAPSADEIPPGIKDILSRLLQKNPARRFESANALVAALDAVGPVHDPEIRFVSSAGKDSELARAGDKPVGTSITKKHHVADSGLRYHLPARPEREDEGSLGAPRQTQPFAIQTRNGRSVAVWPGFDAAELARLLAVVEDMDSSR